MTSSDPIVPTRDSTYGGARTRPLSLIRFGVDTQVERNEFKHGSEKLPARVPILTL